MRVRRVLLYVLFGGLFAASALVVAVITDEPCYERVSECCEDGSCREKDESPGDCYDREVYWCPTECGC